MLPQNSGRRRLACMTKLPMRKQRLTSGLSPRLKMRHKSAECLAIRRVLLKHWKKLGICSRRLSGLALRDLPDTNEIEPNSTVFRIIKRKCLIDCGQSQKPKMILREQPPWRSGTPPIRTRRPGRMLGRGIAACEWSGRTPSISSR